MMRIADKGINKNFGIESSPSANSTATVHAPFDVPIAVNDSSTVTIAEPFQLPLFGAYAPNFVILYDISSVIEAADSFNKTVVSFSHCWHSLELSGVAKSCIPKA